MTAVTERAAIATVPSRIRRRALETPDRVALRDKRFGIWQEVTWRAYWEQVELAAHGLAALGVEPGDRVAIQSENRPEWLYADVATVAVRAITVGLDPPHPPAEVAHLLADSGATVIVADDQELV
jgi:long-chain acyl-CoA synthetase